jgi:hypothetical protein
MILRKVAGSALVLWVRINPEEQNSTSQIGYLSDFGRLKHSRDGGQRPALYVRWQGLDICLVHPSIRREI